MITCYSHFREQTEKGFGESGSHEGTIAHARIAREKLEQGKKKV